MNIPCVVDLTSGHLDARTIEEVLFPVELNWKKIISFLKLFKREFFLLSPRSSFLNKQDVPVFSASFHTSQLLRQIMIIVEIVVIHLSSRRINTIPSPFFFYRIRLDSRSRDREQRSGLSIGVGCMDSTPTLHIQIPVIVN